MTLRSPSKSRLPPRAQKAGRPRGRFTQHRRIDRLREALESSPPGLTLEDLAIVLRVTPRSVRRYLRELERLRELESIETTPGGPHLWRIKASERGRAVSLRRTQAYGLLASRRSLECLRGSAFFEELDLAYNQVLLVAQRPVRTSAKSDISPDARLDNRFVCVPVESRSYATRAEEFDALFQGVAELRAIRFRDSIDSSGMPIILSPYAIVVARGAVFAIGDADQSDTRVVIPLDRMTHVEVLSHTRPFEVPPDFELEHYLHGEFGVWAPSRASVEVIVEFDPSAAAQLRARRVHPTQKIAMAPDGRMRLSVRVPSLDAVRPWLLGFGASARVVAPPELAAVIAAELRMAAGYYA